MAGEFELPLLATMDLGAPGLDFHIIWGFPILPKEGG